MPYGRSTANKFCGCSPHSLQHLWSRAPLLSPWPGASHLLLDSAQARQRMISINEGAAAAPEDVSEANPYSKSYLN